MTLAWKKYLDAKTSVKSMNCTAILAAILYRKLINDKDSQKLPCQHLGAVHMKIVFPLFPRLTVTAWKVSKYGVLSGPYFPAFELHTERYLVSHRIQSKWGKIQTRKNSVVGYISHSAGKRYYFLAFIYEIFPRLGDIYFGGLVGGKILREANIQNG